MQDVTVQAPPPPTPPPAPAPPVIVEAEAQAGPVTISTAALNSPREIYRALEQKRDVLGEYMSRLLNRRDNVIESLQSPQTGPVEKAALEQHLAELNNSIITMEKQISETDAQVAAAAGVPGATIREQRPERNDGGPPEEAFVVGAAFMGIAMVVLAISYARRLWKGGGKVIAQIPAAFENRFTRLEQSLDAVAIEIERVSEGQRFLTRVFSEQNPRPVGAGAAQSVDPSGDRHGEPIRRG